MRKMIFILFIALFTVFWELRALKKDGRIREIVVSSCFLAIGLTLGVIEILNIQIPSPMLAVQYLFTPISQFVSSVLS